MVHQLSILIQFAHNVMCPISYMLKQIYLEQILDVMHVVILIAIFVILPSGKFVEVVKMDMTFNCTLKEMIVSNLLFESCFLFVIILAHY